VHPVKPIWNAKSLSGYAYAIKSFVIETHVMLHAKNVTNKYVTIALSIVQNRVHPPTTMYAEQCIASEPTVVTKNDTNRMSQIECYNSINNIPVNHFNNIILLAGCSEKMGNFASTFGVTALSTMKHPEIASLVVQIDQVWNDVKEQNPYMLEFLAGQKLDSWLDWQKQKEWSTFQRQIETARSVAMEERNKLLNALQDELREKPSDYMIPQAKIDTVMCASRKLLLLDHKLEDWEAMEWKCKEEIMRMTWKLICEAAPAPPSFIELMKSFLQTMLTEAQLSKEKGATFQIFIQHEMKSKLSSLGQVLATQTKTKK
jgi:hypothetical protein